MSRHWSLVRICMFSLVRWGMDLEGKSVMLLDANGSRVFVVAVKQ